MVIWLSFVSWNVIRSFPKGLWLANSLGQLSFSVSIVSRKEVRNVSYGREALSFVNSWNSSDILWQRSHHLHKFVYVGPRCTGCEMTRPNANLTFLSAWTAEVPSFEELLLWATYFGELRRRFFVHKFQIPYFFLYANKNIKARREPSQMDSTETRQQPIEWQSAPPIMIFSICVEFEPGALSPGPIIVLR